MYVKRVFIDETNFIFLPTQINIVGKYNICRQKFRFIGKLVFTNDIIFLLVKPGISAKLDRVMEDKRKEGRELGVSQVREIIIFLLWMWKVMTYTASLQLGGSTIRSKP